MMWFSGEDANSLKIGYATGTSATSWTKHQHPGLTAGSPGSWDDHSVFFPRVLYHNGLYEMWYGGMRSMTDRRIGYATTSDGIHWRKSSENPVLIPGPTGSWDGGVLLVGDILFDGHVYHMWYSGAIDPKEEMGAWPIGYAISPRGTSVTVSQTYATVGDPVRISVRVADPARLSFLAEIYSQEGEVVNRIELFDDGLHEDGLAADGFFSNSWIPKGEEHYFVDLKLKFQKKEFRLKDAAAFTTVGAITYEGLKFLDDATPHPGDTILVKLVLRNHGRTASARSVEASISAADSLVRDITTFSPTYGDIEPGGNATTIGYYRLFIDPDCPPNTDVRLNISISSSGIFLWQDAFIFRVIPQWWRTEWAYALYVLIILGSVIGTVRYVEVKKLKRRIRQLERERALERERTRISQDMHDEVGARLTEIGILSELAKKDIEDPRQAELQIQKISQTSREVIANIGEIIWAINAKNDSLDDLVAYMREYTSKYLGATAIKCTFDFPDAVPTLHLSTEARRNIFLVVKETLHNVVKHSGATEVLMRISSSARNIEITIEDHGKGFDITQSSRFGNGLRNMEKRMKDIGGTFAISSKLGQGTKVVIGVRHML